MGNKLRKLLPGRSAEDETVTGKEGTYTEKPDTGITQETGTSQTQSKNENNTEKMSEKLDSANVASSENAAPPSAQREETEPIVDQQVSRCHRMIPGGHIGLKRIDVKAIGVKDK